MCKPNDNDDVSKQEEKVDVGADDVVDLIDYTSNSYDATARSCAWCYGQVSTTTGSSSESCPNCPRVYCSPSCSAMDSQPNGGHNFWCGKTGEKGIDFDVLPIPGKGLGLVTKRPFARGEKILFERPIVLLSESNSTNNSSSEEKEEKEEEEHEGNHNIRMATMALTPLGGTLKDKLHANRVAVGSCESSSGVFLTFSRVNHACVGACNTDHYFDEKNGGVQLLVANHDIESGVELTFPYSRMGNKKERQHQLKWRGFECDCTVCDSAELSNKLEVLQELEDVINSLGGGGGGKITARQIDLAIQSAYGMLDLMDQLKVSDRDYARVHYDLFQLLVLRKSTLHKSQFHIQKAYQHALNFCGYEKHDTVQQFLHYHNHPEQHSNYLIAAAAMTATATTTRPFSA